AARLDPAEGVHADRMLRVRRVEVYDVLRAAARDVVEEVRRQVPVRVYDTDAPPGLDVLQYHIPKQRRLSGAALPDDVEVLPPVLGRQAEGALVAPFLASAHKYAIAHAVVQSSPRSAGLKPRRRPSSSK